MSIQKAFVHLKERMKRTKSARFRADQRLRDQNKLAQFSLMFLSVYLMAVSFGKTFEVDYFEHINADFWVTVCSIAVLGISSLEAGNDRGARAFRLHENAQKIGKVLGKAQIIDEQTCTDVTYLAFLDEYEEIISECDFNHDPVDNWQSTMDDRDAHWWRRTTAGIKFAGGVFVSNGFYWAAIVAPPIALFLYTLNAGAK